MDIQHALPGARWQHLIHLHRHRVRQLRLQARQGGLTNEFLDALFLTFISDVIIRVEFRAFWQVIHDDLHELIKLYTFLGGHRDDYRIRVILGK